MSFFIGDDGKKYSIFGDGGVERTSKEFNKNFLGEIPINSEVGKFGDIGKPIVESKPDHNISKIYNNFAKYIKKKFIIFLVLVDVKNKTNITNTKPGRVEYLPWILSDTPPNITKNENIKNNTIKLYTTYKSFFSFIDLIKAKLIKSKIQNKKIVIKNM